MFNTHTHIHPHYALETPLVYTSILVCFNNNHNNNNNNNNNRVSQLIIHVIYM